MVAEEWYEALRMRIESVEPEDVGEFRHGCVVQEGFAESEVGGEVEWSVKACIYTVSSHSTGEGGRNGGVWVEDFADSGQRRVESVKLCVEGVPERTANVGECVDSETIQPGLLDPPYCVLNEVFGDGRVFLVEVRELIGEPSLGDVALVAPWCVRVGERFEVTLRDGMVSCGAMEPGGVGRVVNPRV
jgi:hypothetical protein